MEKKKKGLRPMSKRKRKRKGRGAAGAYVPKRTTLYFGYGSNMHEGQMSDRCPGAVPLGAATLAGWALREHGYADVVPSSGEITHGVLWRITPECERALDRYEGVASGLYVKRLLKVNIHGKPVKALVYRMSAGYGQPGAYSLAYALDCAIGAATFGVPVDPGFLRRVKSEVYGVAVDDESPCRWYEQVAAWDDDDEDDDGDGLQWLTCDGCGNPAACCECDNLKASGFSLSW